MEYARQREILVAIQRDDLKKFSELADGTLGGFRMGRFPLLSLIYLYGADRIARVYEGDMIGKNGWEELPEPPELSAKFASVAKKALRLYQNEVVSPIEMLLLLGRAKKAKTLYLSVRLSAAQKGRLVSLYSISYGLPVTFSDKGIEVSAPPMSYRNKKRIFLSVASALLIVALIVSTPFVVNVFSPFIGVERTDSVSKDDPIEPTPSDTVVEVSSFEEVQFDSAVSYRLTADLTAPADFRVETVDCTFDGGGKSIVLSGDKPFFGTVNGTIKNVRFVAEGNWTKTGNFAFVAENNNGLIQDVSLSVKGSLTVSNDSEQGTYLAGIALTNVSVGADTGILSDCSADYDLTIVAERTADASFSGICAQNKSTVRGCAVTGKIDGTLCDLAGICCENAYFLYQDKNEAALTQRAAEKQWSPVCAGIVLKNSSVYYNAAATVRECENGGEIFAESTFDSEEPLESTSKYYLVECAGICAVNENGAIIDSKNTAKISARAVECVPYVGGVCARSSSKSSLYYSPTIERAINSGEISAETQKTACYLGGLVAEESGTAIKNGENSGKVEGRTVDAACYAGGLVAIGTNGTFSDGKNTASVTVTITDGKDEDSYCAAGGIVANGNGSSFSGCENTGDITAHGAFPAVYLGGIGGITSAVTGSKSSGKITSDVVTKYAYLGGLVGRANSDVTNSFLSGEICLSGAEGADCGGLVAYTAFNVTNCISNASINATGKTLSVGGAVGVLSMDEYTYYRQTYVICGKVQNVIAEGTIEVGEEDESFVGGLVGESSDKLYEWTSNNEQKSELFGTFVTGSYALVSISGGSHAVVGSVIGRTTDRLILADVELTDDNRHFIDNAYLLEGTKKAFGRFDSVDTSEEEEEKEEGQEQEEPSVPDSPGEAQAAPTDGDLDLDHGAHGYETKEEIESLDGYKAIADLFSGAETEDAA